MSQFTWADKSDRPKAPREEIEDHSRRYMAGDE